MYFLFCQVPVYTLFLFFLGIGSVLIDFQELLTWETLTLCDRKCSFFFFFSSLVICLLNYMEFCHVGRFFFFGRAILLLSTSVTPRTALVLCWLTQLGKKKERKLFMHWSKGGQWFVSRLHSLGQAVPERGQEVNNLDLCCNNSVLLLQSESVYLHKWMSKAVC